MTHRGVMTSAECDAHYAQPQPPHWTKHPGRHLVLEPAAIQCLITGGPVLELGCGVGHLGQLLRECGLCDYLGVDTSAKSIASAVAGVRVMVAHRGCVRRLLASRRWRTVVALEVLEHVPDDERMLRLVPPGTSVVISVPSYWTDGHVRVFPTLAMARARYEPMLRLADVQTTVDGRNRWHILRGVMR